MIIRSCEESDIGIVSAFARGRNALPEQRTSFMTSEQAGVEREMRGSLGASSIQVGAFEEGGCLGYLHIIIGEEYVPGDTIGPFYAEGREDIAVSLLEFAIQRIKKSLVLKFNIDFRNPLFSIIAPLGLVRGDDNYFLEIDRNKVAPVPPRDGDPVVGRHGKDNDAALKAIFEACFEDAYLSAAQVLAADGEEYRLADATLGGELVGFGLYRARRGWIDFVAVRKDRRGLGYGRLLLSAILREYFSEPGINTVGLDVDLSNEGALRLYTDLGFIAKEHFLSGSLAIGDQGSPPAETL